MASKKRIVNIGNIHAGGDISIALDMIEQYGLDSETMMEKLEPIIKEAIKKGADEIIRDMLGAFKNIESEIYIRRDDIQRTYDFFSNAVWSAIEDDKLSQFELKPHILNLVKFFDSRREFFIEYARSGKQLTLKTLSEVLLNFKRREKDRKELKRVQYLQGVAFFLRFKYSTALRELEPIARQNPDSLAILMLVAESALNIGQFSVALRHFQRARSLPINYNKHTVLRRALLLSNIGACHEELLESELAVENYEEALSTIADTDMNVYTNLIRALIMNNLGFSLMTISNETEDDSNLEKAEELFCQALELREVEEDTDANLASVMFNIAEVNRKLGQPADADYWLDRAAGKMDSFGQPHILHATIWNAQGQSQFDRGEYRKALASFHQARQTLEANFGEYSIKLAYTTYSIAQALEALSDPAAQSYLNSARRLAFKNIKDNMHPFIRMIDDDIERYP